ncbi:hypothetical protein L2E82_22616 [Cichorium intybus]|uniref:Uncharacterized protein n=1 Tax=Cichorium intybus TaxID=13427 RepID=A0ACB9DYL7_CICIN|nr:hypothetical protein L2E82_22616 [Cichorium intybus]
MPKSTRLLRNKGKCLQNYGVKDGVSADLDEKLFRKITGSDTSVGLAELFKLLKGTVQLHMNKPVNQESQLQAFKYS